MTLGWAAVVGYFAVTIALAINSARRNRTFATYAVAGDLPAVVVGLSLAAQLTSVATFVVNPGLVYAYGLSALFGYGVAAGTGIMLGLAVFSRRFRTQGTRVQAVTVPQWIGKRFDAPGLRVVFALLSLALVTFSTLIVVGLALVMAPLLELPAQWIAPALAVIAVASIAIGGATGHAWINAVQAVIMLAVAVLLIGAGLPLLASGEIGTRLRAIDPNLLDTVNPSSPFFRSLFEVFVCNFIIGVAIVCQPHVISKALFLRTDRDVRRYLTTAIACGVVFTSVLVTGFWARLTLTETARIDLAIPTWIATQFSPEVQTLITIGMLCAGLSTLEGIFLALSTIISADLYPLIRPARTDDESLLAGRIGLVIAAVITAALSIRQINNPTAGTVAIFAQYGVYLLFSASFIPLVSGMFLPGIRRGVVTSAVAGSLATYFVLAATGTTRYSNNPAFLAAMAIVAGLLIVVGGQFAAPRATPA
jgi:SSS family solute:Na+ symporter/sodium/pantothenate symporter